MKKLYIFLIAVLLLALCCIVYISTPKRAVEEYTDIDKLGSNFIHSGKEEYMIGAAEDGMPVFVDPSAAFRQAKKDFAQGFKQLQEEFKLKPVGKHNFEGYKNYGWQTDSDDECIREQCNEISLFFDIYENSYN